MLVVVMYCTTLLTLIISVCTILWSHTFMDGNAPLGLLSSNFSILNSMACCSSFRFHSSSCSPSFVQSDSAYDPCPTLITYGLSASMLFCPTFCASGVSSVLSNPISLKSPYNVSTSLLSKQFNVLFFSYYLD